MGASTDIEQKLLSFLAGQFALQHHQLVVKIELLYAPASGFSPESLASWSAEDGQNAELFSERGHVWVERLCGKILELANSHADTYGQGRHRFQVRAYQHLGSRQLHAFVILPTYDGSDQALVQQQLAEPSQTNLVGQLMRHLENRDRGQREMFESFLRAMTHSVNTIKDENQALREALANRDMERMNMLLKIEEANSKEHERQIEAKTVIADADRKDYAVKKVFGLLPVAISQGLSHLAKKKDGGDDKPKEPTPLAKLAMRLMGSLKTSQREIIEDTLSIEQRILLSEAARVAADGGSLILPALLHELAASLQGKQVGVILNALEPEQREMFAAVLKLASAQTETATGEQSQPPEGSQEAAAANGTEVSSS